MLFFSHLALAWQVFRTQRATARELSAAAPCHRTKQLSRLLDALVVKLRAATARERMACIMMQTLVPTTYLGFE